MAAYPYTLVDVFTTERFGGNPLAVFLNAERIPEALYQPIARELNLSETTFVLPPEDASNHYRVRIFTGAFELPMAGHPTVGTAYVLARGGHFDPGPTDGVLRLEEGVGLVPVSVEAGPNGEPGRITMQQPLPTFGAVFADRAVVAETLGLNEDDLLANAPVQIASTGVPFWYVALRSLDAVRRLSVRPDLWQRHFGRSESQKLFVFTMETEHAASTVHARMMALDVRLLEDPATGGASGPLGCYLVRHGLVKPQPDGDAPGMGVTRIVSEQGIEMGRPSFLHIAIHTDGDTITRVRVGGDCVPIGHGVLEL